ncbi:hypothetical protein TcWFU_008523 [Taenia crassiceps]|uniref:Uncharacterized protein n=1 Tax=Taenia crassiceps TaxID=6207 RepID=A0ABR4QUV7_9CEST
MCDNQSDGLTRRDDYQWRMCAYQRSSALSPHPVTINRCCCRTINYQRLLDLRMPRTSLPEANGLLSTASTQVNAFVL